MTGRRLRLAAAQYPIDRLDGWQAYEAKLAAWVAGAVAEGAQLLVFPEYGAMELASLFPDPVPGDLLAQLPAVASLEARVVELHQALARRHGVHILGASLPVEAGPGRYHNRAWLYGPDGRTGFPGQDRHDPLRAGGLGRVGWQRPCACSTPPSAGSASASATTSSSRCWRAASPRPGPS